MEKQTLNGNLESTAPSAIIPVSITGVLGTISIENEILYLNEDELVLLAEKGVDLSNQQNAFDQVVDINDQIAILFALHKQTSAWELISNNVDTINFEKIATSPFFTLDRKNIKVFEYMYDNNIIDDKTYSYFNVISGELFDREFWEDEFSKCTSASDVLEIIYSSFNGYNQFDLGMITLTDWLKKIIFDSIQDGEILDDYIIGNKSAVEFSAKDMLGLMMTGNLTITDSVAAIIFERGSVIPEEDCSKEMFEYLGKTMSERAYSGSEELIMTLSCNTLPYMKAFLESAKLIMDGGNELYANTNYIVSSIIRSEAFINYPYIVCNYIQAIFGYEYFNEKINNCNAASNLPPKKYSMVYALSYLSFIDTSDFKFIYPFPRVYDLVYNKKRNIVYCNNQVIPAEEFTKETVSWAYNYITWREITNNEIFQKCNSEEEYEEVALAVTELADYIILNYV